MEMAAEVEPPRRGSGSWLSHSTPAAWEGSWGSPSSQLPRSWLPPISCRGQPSRSGRAASFWRSSAVIPHPAWIRSPSTTTRRGRQRWARASRALSVPASPSLGKGMPWA